MSFCAAATIINVYAKHSISILTFAVIHSSWGASDMETQVYCVFIESLTEKREKGVRARTPGWYRSLLFLVCTPLSSLHYTSLILHNITSAHEQQVGQHCIVLFTPQSDCPRKCIIVYYVEWRLCGLLQHIGAVSTKDRTGCDGVMLCTGSVQVYTNFQRSSSPARSPLLTSGPVCVLSPLAGLRSLTYGR